MDTSFKELFLLLKANVRTVIKITFISSVIGVIYALLATPIYKSELYMISTEQNSEGLLGGGIQGIASQFGLAGNLDLGSNSESMYNKRVAMKFFLQEILLLISFIRITIWDTSIQKNGILISERGKKIFISLTMKRS